MKILLTGSRGMLGHALIRALAGHDVIATDSSTLDITHAEAVELAVAEIRPDVIINAAAYTAVDAAETDAERALLVNGTAVGYLAAAAKQHDALLVHFSTDYVFDGGKAAGYREDDIPSHPVNVYGVTKLAGERLILDSGCRYALIRTSWLFGPDGLHFVDTMLRLGAERPELKIVADQHGCPTYTPDLAAATRDLLEDGATGVFHLTNREPTTWADFANEIFRQAVETLHATSLPRVEPIPSSDYPTPAQRPQHSILLNTKRPPLRSWREALADYLAIHAKLSRITSHA